MWVRKQSSSKFVFKVTGHRGQCAGPKKLTLSCKRFISLFFFFFLNTIHTCAMCQDSLSIHCFFAHVVTATICSCFFQSFFWSFSKGCHMNSHSSFWLPFNVPELSCFPGLANQVCDTGVSWHHTEQSLFLLSTFGVSYIRFIFLTLYVCRVCANNFTFISLSIFSSSVSSYPSRRKASSLVKEGSSGCSPKNVSVNCTNWDTLRLLSSKADICDWLRFPLLAVRPAVKVSVEQSLWNSWTS